MIYGGATALLMAGNLLGSKDEKLRDFGVAENKVDGENLLV